MKQVFRYPDTNIMNQIFPEKFRILLYSRISCPLFGRMLPVTILLLYGTPLLFGTVSNHFVIQRLVPILNYFRVT